MTFDPRRLMGPQDGVLRNKEGRDIGFFWENPVTKEMTDEERKAYWAEYDKNKG